MIELAEIQDFTQTVVRAVSAVVGVPVLIVDRHRRRIAGTDRWEHSLGTIMDPGFLLPQVMVRGEPIALYRPAHEPVCQGCPQRLSCNETATLAVPIRAHGELIGAFGLVAVTQEQRTHLMGNHDSLLQFLDRMSDLLAAKATEHEHARRLQHLASEREAIIEAINEGVVAVDCALNVTHRNAAANRLFQVRPQDRLVLREPLRRLLEAVVHSGTRLQDEEVVLEGLPRVHLFVSARPIRVGDQITGAVTWLKDALEVHRLASDVGSSGLPLQFEDIIGDSPVMLLVKDLALQVARGRSTVLLTGESGTGKELFARAIHAASPRRDGPFVAVDCAALPPDRIEAELFGQRAGPGVAAEADGLFQAAQGGSLFLDAVAELPAPVQAKLQQALERQAVRPLGGDGEVPIDVRLLSASHHDLARRVEEGRFRHDLYYRLHVLDVAVPPLRERREDLPALVEAALARRGGEPPRLADDALAALHDYPFPGNVRELESLLERAVALAEGPLIHAADLDLPAPGHGPLPGRREADPGETAEADAPLPAMATAMARARAAGALPQALEQVEREAILRALEAHRWNRTRTAAALGITFRALRYKLKKLGIE